jgi:hypothetical protein
MLQESVSPFRRHSSRVAIQEGVWVFWSCDWRDELSHVRDLSLGGLFVETARPRAVGATSTLDFLVQEGQIRADATVQHLRPGRGVGLKFTALKDADRPHLVALLKRLSL